MKEFKIDLPENERERLKQWIADIVRCSGELYGLDPDALEEDYATESHSYHFGETYYSYYTECLEFSQDELNDLAEIYIRRLIEQRNHGNILLSMAENFDVLINEQKSARWLRPFVGAERTSLAYERGKALARLGYTKIARELMRSAADAGDDFCALYLIENTLKGMVYGFVKGLSARNESTSSDKTTSLLFETAMCLIDRGEDARAQDLLRKDANCGGTASAMYLIEQTLNKEIKERKGLKNGSF